MRPVPTRSEAFDRMVVRFAAFNVLGLSDVVRTGMPGEELGAALSTCRAEVAALLAALGPLQDLELLVLGDPVEAVMGTLDPRLMLQIRWTVECGAVIGWALGLGPEVPAPTERLDLDAVEHLSPAAAEIEGLRSRAAYRPPEELAALKIRLLAEHQQVLRQYPAGSLERSRAIERLRGILWLELGGDLDRVTLPAGAVSARARPSFPHTLSGPRTARQVVDRAIATALAGDLAILRGWDTGLSADEAVRASPVLARCGALGLGPEELTEGEQRALNDAVVADREELREVAARRSGATALAWALGWVAEPDGELEPAGVLPAWVPADATALATLRSTATLRPRAELAAERDGSWTDRAPGSAAPEPVKEPEDWFAALSMDPIPALRGWAIHAALDWVLDDRIPVPRSWP